jgi:hypothetical protein
MTGSAARSDAGHHDLQVGAGLRGKINGAIA